MDFGSLKFEFFATPLPQVAGLSHDMQFVPKRVRL